jgi:hypothetical protein
VKREENDEESAMRHYRLRVQRIEEEKPVDLEWNPRILYEPPKAYPSKRKTTYLIQIICNDIRVYDIANIADKAAARKRYMRIKRDLRSQNKEDFEKRYEIYEMSESDKDAVEEKYEEKDINNDNKAIISQLRNAMLFAGEVRINKDKKNK